MSIKERIAADTSEAMKRRDAGKVDALRLLRAAIKNAEIDKRRELSDEETVSVIRTSLKQLKEAREQFAAGGRPDLVEKNDREIGILSAYLPAELSAAELGALVKETVGSLPAAGPKDFGKVMQAVMGKVAGRVEGSRVSEEVRKVLGSV